MDMNTVKQFREKYSEMANAFDNSLVGQFELIARKMLDYGN